MTDQETNQTSQDPYNAFDKWYRIHIQSPDYDKDSNYCYWPKNKNQECFVRKMGDEEWKKIEGPLTTKMEKK